MRHAKDYVEMQWLMLQQDNPSDYVISGGSQSSVREFVQLSARHLGIELEFEARIKKSMELCFNRFKFLRIKARATIIRIDEKYFRPSEVDTLLGSSKKAHETLGWNPNYTRSALHGDDSN